MESDAEPVSVVDQLPVLNNNSYSNLGGNCKANRHGEPSLLLDLMMDEMGTLLIKPDEAIEPYIFGQLERVT